MVLPGIYIQVTDTEQYENAKKRGIREGDCLIWPGGAGGKNGFRYGLIWSNGKQVQLHRFTYRMEHGWLPEPGTRPLYVVSHLCHRSLCFEPKHLIVETQQDNLLRRPDDHNHNKQKTACPKGHPYDYVYPSGKRGCLRCISESGKKNREARKLRAARVRDE